MTRTEILTRHLAQMGEQHKRAKRLYKWISGRDGMDESTAEHNLESIGFARLMKMRKSDLIRHLTTSEERAALAVVHEVTNDLGFYHDEVKEPINDKQPTK